jgi:hypothetical protein
MFRPDGIDGRPVPAPDGGCAAPQPRFDERSYVSVFLFAKHTLVAEIFVFRQGLCPIATIVTRLQPPPPDHNDRTDPGCPEQDENGDADQE